MEFEPLPDALKEPELEPAPDTEPKFELELLLAPLDEPAPEKTKGKHNQKNVTRVNDKANC